MAHLLIALLLGGAVTQASAQDIAATCPIRPGTLCVEADLNLRGADLRWANFEPRLLEGADTRGCIGCRG